MRDKVLAAIELYAAGGTIEKACELAGVSNTPFRRLLREDTEIHDKYEMAMQARGYVYHDEAYKVASEMGTDSGLNAPDARTKADILIKLGAQAFPDRFGMRQNVQHEIKPSITEAIAEARRRALPPGRDLAPVLDAEYTMVTDACTANSSDKQSAAFAIVADPGAVDPFEA